jgi:signal transduction histidine kinase
MTSTTDVAAAPPATRTPTRRAKDSARALQAAQTQLQALLAVTDTALSYLALDDLLRELLGRVAAVMQVDQVIILLLDEGGQTLTLRAARGVFEELIGQVRAVVGQGEVGRIAATQEPVIVNEPSAADLPLAPSPLREQLHALAGVPFLVRNPGADSAQDKQIARLLGVISVGSTTPRRFTEVDVQLLQRAADRIALAIDHALVYAAELEARRRAEAALSRALVSEAQATDRAEQLQTVLETIADGVAVYDAEGRPIQTNRAYRELFALERAPAGFTSLPSLHRAKLLHLRDTAGAPLALEHNPADRALRGEEVTGEDIRARAFDGRELELNVSAAPMRRPDGRIVGAVADARDFTEHNRLEREREEAHANEEAAQQASERMQTFVATAAHDLRTPLSATVGYLDLAQSKIEQHAARVQAVCPNLAPSVAAVHDRVEVASESADRLKRLLNLLFDSAAIRSGKLELRRVPCDLVALVREQVAALRVASPDRTILLRTPAHGRPVPVEADADRIGQVVTNFVSNALKYSPPARPVYVAVKAQSDHVRVAVRDAGPGIPKAEQAQLWELFHRVAGVAQQGEAMSGSLGLGLYISKAIMEAHGGQVGVMSAVGTGSTFWFTLPLSGEIHLPAEP